MNIITCHRIIKISCSLVIILFNKKCALLESYYFSSVLCQTNSIDLLTTTDLWGSRLLNRFICVPCIASWVHCLVSIGIDTLLVCVLCQLKSSPDLYAGYVPMGYSDYLKKMSKYVRISHYGILFLLIWLHHIMCLLIAFVWMYQEWWMGWSCHIAGCCRLGMRK